MAQIQASPVDAVRSSAKPGSMVTIRDVAKESGFSSTTVSIVLNNAPLARYIPAVTKKRIERAAQKLGYRPNQFARSLRSKRSHTVGVMVFDMTDPFCTLILRGIENTLNQSSFLPILTDVHNERSRFERYLEMLLDRRIEALIVLANWVFLDINLLADLEKSSIPTAMIGCELKTDSISSIIVDNEVGGYVAFEHLHSLGHRKIAFIRGPRALLRDRLRRCCSLGSLPPLAHDGAPADGGYGRFGRRTRGRRHQRRPRETRNPRLPPQGRAGASRSRVHAKPRLRLRQNRNCGFL